MKFSFRLMAVVVVAALLLSACAVASRDALIGKWGSTTQDLVLEFTMDGHIRQTSQGTTTEMGFQFVDNNTIKLQTPASGGTSQPIPFTVSGDKLTLMGIDSAGKPSNFEFQRVK